MKVAGVAAAVLSHDLSVRTRASTEIKSIRFAERRGSGRLGGAFGGVDFTPVSGTLTFVALTLRSAEEIARQA